jgi:hypothetical protein
MVTRKTFSVDVPAEDRFGGAGLLEIKVVFKVKKVAWYKNNKLPKNVRN